MQNVCKYKDWNISYSTYGKRGKTGILLIHGASSDRRIWEQLANLASDSSFLISYDLLGHGESEKPQTTYGVEVWIENVERLVNHLELENVVLVAHSFGVLIAKEFYSRHPHLTKAMVIVDGALKQVLSEPIYQWMKTTLDRPDYEDYMKSLNAHSQTFCLKKKHSDLINDGVLNTPKHVLKGQLESMRNKEESDVLIKCPVLAIYTDSHEWNSEVEAYLRKHVLDLDLHVWQDTSHFVMLEKPKEMWELLQDFLGNRNLSVLTY